MSVKPAEIDLVGGEIGEVFGLGIGPDATTTTVPTSTLTSRPTTTIALKSNGTIAARSATD
jgi:hypothetical protein